MDIATIITALLTLPILHILTHYLTNLYRAHHHRPLTPLTYPIIGSAIDFGTAPIAYLQQCTTKYGYMFTLNLGPLQQLAFLTDINSFNTVWKSKQLAWNPITTHIMHTVFSQSRVSVGKLDDQMNPQYRQYLQASELEKQVPVSQYYYIEHFNTTLLPLVPSTSKWVAIPNLRDIVCPAVFYSGTQTLWNGGQVTDKAAHTAVLYNPDLYDIFLKFDAQFQLLATGLPAFLVRSSRDAQRTIREQLDKHYLHANRQTLSNMIAARYKTFDENISLLTKSGEKDYTAILTAFFWAVSANQIPSAYWVLVHILFHPAAHAAVREEIDSVLKKHGGKPLTRAVMDEMVILDGCISETLRLVTHAMSLRESTADQTFTTSDKKQYNLKKGEQIAILLSTVHYNASIYPNPTQYIYNRFLLAKSLPPAESVKYINPVFNGVKLPSSLTFLPFGGGQTICPGRILTRVTQMQLVVFMLSTFDIELTGKSKEQLPQIDVSRVGLGVMPVVGDVSVRMKRRETNPLQQSNDALYGSMTA